MDPKPITSDQLIEIMKNLIPILPWASDEIELFIKEACELVQKINCLEQIVQDQEYKITYLTRKNNELNLLNEERVQIYGELEQHINDLEKQNEECKEEKLLSQQCIKSLSEMIAKLEHTCSNLNHQLEKNQVELLKIESTKRQQIDLNNQSTMLNKHLEEIENLHELLNKTNQQLNEEFEQNQLLRTKIQTAADDFSYLEDQYAELLDKYNRSKNSKCVCLDKSQMQQDKSNNEIKTMYKHFNEKCEKFFSEFRQSVIFDISSIDNLSLNDEFIELNQANLSHLMNDLNTTGVNKSSPADVNKSVANINKSISNVNNSLADVNKSVADIINSVADVNKSITDVNKSTSVRAMDCSTQTDSKILCYIYEDNNIDLTVYDNHTDKSHFKNVPKNRRLRELFNVLREKYTRKTKSVATNTANNSVIIRSNNVVMECRNEEKLNKKELLKGLKTCILPSNSKLASTIKDNNLNLSRPHLESSTPLKQNAGNSAPSVVTDLGVNVDVKNEKILSKISKEDRNKIKAASETFAKLKNLQVSYAQIVKGK